jgi:organic radical activating enzyme
MSRSLCTFCLDEVYADIIYDEGVHIVKHCPTCGDSFGLIEPDMEFYHRIKNQQSDTIYPGMFIDVTAKCNMACDYCYHDKVGGNISKDELLSLAQKYSHYAPFFLSGGEPTLHPDLPEIITSMRSYGAVGVVSNGTMTQDKTYCSELAGLLNYGSDTVALGLSYHNTDAVANTLENLSSIGKKASSVLFVISDISEIDGCLAFFRKYRNAIDHIRVKAGTALWNESKHSGIFVSDMVNHLRGCNVDISKDNKTSFVNIVYQDLPIMLVSWYTRNNVDIYDIDCPPYYLAKDGSLNNLVLSCIKNEARLCV